MSTQHTPGPWILDERDNSITGADGTTVCEDGSGAFIAIPNDADARLIAAAPDMLESLKLCRQYMYEHASNTPDNAFDKLCAAIAKATGEKS
jgi:hypothetical protein